MMLEGDRVEGENENFVGAKIKLFVVQELLIFELELKFWNNFTKYVRTVITIIGKMMKFLI